MDVNKLMRYLAYTLEIFILYMLQQTPGLIPEIYGGRPVLILAAVLTIAMMEEFVAAAAFGILGGLLMDYGLGGILGINALLLVVICCVISWLCHTVMQINLGTAMVTVIVSAAVVILLIWVVRYLIPGYSEPVYALTRRYLPNYLLTLLFAPLIFILNKGLSKFIRTPE